MDNHRLSKNLELKTKVTIYAVLKWLIIVAIVVLLVLLAIKPLRKGWSDNYVEEGNIYLKQKKYLTAELQYRKALLLNRDSSEAKKMIFVVKEATKDVLTLKDFYQQRKLEIETSLYAKAQSVPENEVEAVKLAKELIEKEQYQLAIIPAKTATLMDRNYFEAWLYLGIANIETARHLEAKDDQKQNYFQEAKEAFSRATELNKDDQALNNYLKSL